MPCVVCGKDVPPPTECETARVRSNVRRFRDEQFAVWRCPHCRSLHATEEVDLAHYYAGYPVFSAALDWKLEVVYGSLLARLRENGLAEGQRILDYGCGAGVLVKFLRSKGYAAEGWDAYAAEYRDPSVLEARYACVVAQDVIEHVPDPHDLVRTLDQLTEGGGIVSIGTPDAAAIDLAHAGDFIHTLHLPFHRHILTGDALRKCGDPVGWQLSRYYSTMYNNTLFPTMNPRFVLHYVRAADDCFDLVTEPIQTPLRLFTPATLFFALFGFFFDRHTDVQAVFRKP